MKRRRFTLDECCRHEAGHFLAKLFLGLGGAEMIATVLDEPDAQGSLGYVEHWPGQHECEAGKPRPARCRRALPKELGKYASTMDEAERLTLARNMIASYAGCVAQWPCRWLTSASFDGAEKDIIEVEECALEVGYWPPRRWRLPWFAAAKLIDGRFGEMIAIARALRRTRRLTGTAMIEIAARAPKFQNPYRDTSSCWPGDDAPDLALTAALVTWLHPSK